MSMAITVRAAEAADLEVLGRALAGPATRAIAGTMQVPYTSFDEQRERFARRDAAHNRFLVAELDGQPVGMAGLHVNTRLRTRHCAAFGMWVLDEVQGRGVGAALLDALIDLAEKWAGVLRLELDVWVDNAPALALYRSRGFVIEGVAVAGGLRDGAVVDIYRMARVAPSLPWPRIAATSAESVMTALDLAPHPEGGFFRETWRDAPAGGARGTGTAIYFVLRAGDAHRWHRVDAVEIWHHYAGAPLELRIDRERFVLGDDLASGARPQIVIPAGAWQRARTLGDFTLVGCTVSPAFQFEGFELAPEGWEP